MKVTVLGCSGSVPGPDSASSGYLVQAEGFNLVVELGHGAFGALQRYVKPADVDAIVVSHLHADHCIDVTAFVVSLRYGLGAGYQRAADGSRIPLIGPPGTRARIETAYDPLARKLSLHELFGFSTPSAAEVGPFTLAFAAMNHPTATWGMRIGHGGRTLAYSADTGECENLIDLARDADVLLCEASFGPDEEYVPDLHLTGRQAGEHAAKAGVGRLIITHVPPWGSRETQAAEAASTFDGAIDIARPGWFFEV